MRILFVTAHWPHAPTYGAQQRALNICRLLKRSGDVSIIVASPDDGDESTRRRTREEFNVLAELYLEPHTVTSRERLRCEFDPTFMNTHYQVSSPSARELMRQAIAEHDIVWVFGLHEANAFGIYRWPHTVLDIDDVQSRAYAARARASSSLWRKGLHYRMSLIWRRRERRLKDRFDAMVVCSEDDRRYLGPNMAAKVVPNGFAVPAAPAKRTPTSPPRFGFIGLCDYAPNREGLEWFVANVWPAVKREAPGARLRLVGRGTDIGFAAMGPDIDALGYVDDAADEIATWTGMIVPVRFGGGTRIKIAEAFSRRCPVVSTSFGALGYEVGGGSLLIADAPDEFAAACLCLLRDPEQAERLAQNGWKQFTSRWTWEAIGDAVADVVAACAAGGASASMRAAGSGSWIRRLPDGSRT